jgi:HK97 family phage portal protein
MQSGTCRDIIKSINKGVGMAWFDNLLGSVGLIRKSYRLEEKPIKVAHGASWANAYGNKPSYSQLGSLAVFSQHPYVFAALSRLSQDLAATPLRLIKGKGKDSTILEDHPMLDLLHQPSTDVDAFSFLEQIIIDLTAAGNCYILLLGLNDQPDSIVRLHPEQVEILTDNLGIKAYRYNAEGESVDYPPDRIVHGKNASWSTGVQGLYGVGCIQPIAEEIMSDLNINRLVSSSSAKGRPDVILSPANDLDVWDSDTRKQILESYRGLAASGGCLVTSGMLKVDFTQLTPRDVEFQAARQYAKSAITSALGVPASVLGDGDVTANYATARQQAISYWSTLAKRGKRIAHLLTLIAKRWDKDLRVEFDYSGVEALNSMRTEQLQRIQLHIANGMSPSNAYMYEGLEDAPIVAPDLKEPAAEDVGDEDDQSARSLISLLDEDSTEDFPPPQIVERGSVGDRDPTNFPEDFDDKKISLDNSNHKAFDVEFAEQLKLKYPKIWKAGGNIEGNNQYRRLYPIAKREDTEAKTPTEEMAIRKREAWIARHFEDGAQFDENDDLNPNLSNVAGIVAQIKWLAIGTLGESKMKRIINELKTKLDEKTAHQRVNTWNQWFKAKQEPAEKMILNAAKRYFEGAAKRYATRIRNNVKTKSIVDLGELQALAEEQTYIFNSIGGTWQKVWGLVGSSELENVYRLARIPKPLDVQFSQREIMLEYIDTMKKELSQTTADAVRKSVQNGLIDGQSVNEIANNIQTIAAFAPSRSMLIARTESTRAANRAAIAAYEQAQGEGLDIQKEWLASADGNVRDTHAALDGTVIGVNEEFVTDEGYAGQAPGDFGEASEDCNCRCTVIPVVL